MRDFVIPNGQPPDAQIMSVRVAAVRFGCLFVAQSGHFAPAVEGGSSSDTHS